MLPCQFCAHQVCLLLHLDGPGYLSKCRQTHFHLSRRGSPSHLQESSHWTKRQFHSSHSRHVQVWMAEVTHSASHHFSELPQVHAAVLRSEVIPLHSSPTRLNPSVPPAVCVSRLTVSSMF